MSASNSDSTVVPIPNGMFLLTMFAGDVNQLVASVCLFPLHLLNRLTSEFEFLYVNKFDSSSSVIESQCQSQRLWLGLSID